MSQTYVPAALRRLVRMRAGERCEYCLIPENASFAPHQVDHVIAEKHGGLTDANNLALSCVLCNMCKGAISRLSILRRAESRLSTILVAIGGQRISGSWVDASSPSHR